MHTAQTRRLVLELSATTVTAGEELTATCTWSDGLTGSLTLYIDGEIYSQRIVGDIYGGTGPTFSTWTIVSVHREDAGEYYCFHNQSENSPRQYVTVYCEF